jgi:hypothetical protein
MDKENMVFYINNRILLTHKKVKLCNLQENEWNGRSSCIMGCQWLLPEFLATWWLRSGGSWIEASLGK